MLLQPNDHILFYGDSITDCGRRDETNSNDGLGRGYVYLTTQRLQDEAADLSLSFMNRGISGNKVPDLQARLDDDVLALKPTVVSILIGVNDVWHYQPNGPDDVKEPIPSVEEFEAGYRDVLTRIRDGLGARIVLMEPFVLHTPPDRATWRDDLNPRIDVVRTLAREFADRFIPLDGPFAAAACLEPMEHWAADGVHPTEAGAKFIADAWCDAVL